MSNYIPAKKCETPFEGDTVTYSVEPIENADFGKLLPFFKENENGETVIRFEDRTAFLKVAGELLGKYVQDFSGLKDSAGAEITLEVVLKKSYFLGLITAMATELFSASMTHEVEEKNSDAPSEPS